MVNHNDFTMLEIYIPLMSELALNSVFYHKGQASTTEIKNECHASYETSVLPDQSSLLVSGFPALLISVLLYTLSVTHRKKKICQAQSCRFQALWSKGYDLLLILTVIHKSQQQQQQEKKKKYSWVACPFFTVFLHL